MIPARRVVAALALAGCLNSPPASMDAGGGADADAAPPDPAVDIALIGDLLTLDCNDDGGSTLLLDRSGASRHADLGDGSRVEGAFGGGQAIGPATSIFLPRDPDLGPQLNQGFTVEAYVWLASAGQVATIAGDHVAADPTLTFEVEVQNEVRIGYTTNDSGVEEPVSSAELELPLETWTHVAVTWDGSTLAFYLDGALVSTEPETAVIAPVADRRFVHIGSRADGSRRLVGAIDEVKISSYAKSEEQIAASKDFDSRELAGRCGDGLLDAGEACAGAGLCCSDLCEPLEQDPLCAGAGGTCSGGLCKVADPVRVIDGLLAYYSFDSVLAGTTVPDESGVAPAADLVLATGTLGEVPGGVTLADGASLRADEASKIGEACWESNAITVEAWVAPASDTQRGPARVVTYSNGTDLRNVTLGQDAGLWVARVRSDGSDLNGLPMIGSAGAAARTATLSHLVVTVAGDQRRFYVDGKLRSSARVPGGLTGWMPDFPLIVGNEEGGTRPWEGAIHLLAIYGRALDAVEVATNHAAGPDPL